MTENENKKLNEDAFPNLCELVSESKFGETEDAPIAFVVSLRLGTQEFALDEDRIFDVSLQKVIVQLIPKGANISPHEKLGEWVRGSKSTKLSISQILAKSNEQQVGGAAELSLIDLAASTVSFGASVASNVSSTKSMSLESSEEFERSPVRAIGGDSE